MRRWWSRFRAAWKYASGTEAETTLATLFAAKEALAQFLAEAQTKREVIAREWSKAVRRHQNLEAGTKLRCDRMLEKLDKRATEVAEARAELEALRAGVDK